MARRPSRGWRCAPLCVACLIVISAAWTTCAVRAADNAPEPAVITPAPVAMPTAPPSDAIVLFDGKDLSQWTHVNGTPATWKVEDGAFTTGSGTPGAGDIVSKQQFDDAQVHVEFRLPEDGQGHGNSGLYFHHLYEVQIIDSFNDNPYEAGQQCASLYKVYPPLVNVCKKPGEWQTYDIIFHSAKLDDAGKVVTPARFTVFQNGVLVQYNRPLSKGTGGGAANPMISKGPLKIQDHGSHVAFRNIWLRPIPPVGPTTAAPLEHVDHDKHAPKVADALTGIGPELGAAPADAVVLFNGKSLEKWTNDQWLVENGYMQIVPGKGGNSTKEPFGDVQFHIEWATPSEVKGDGQGRGNSGVYLHGRYELQVLDSYHNKTYADGQAGAIYGQYPPLINASRKPGEWQTYDIVYRAPKYDGDGKLIDPGSFTVLHNGVLVQDHSLNKKAPDQGPRDGKPVTGPLHLQDHGNPVRYRNIWYRPLN